jgi:chromosome segregation protein
MARVRLHSLSLAGFKSFPDKVDLTFPSDVSAIIGPNGCGKSNLVDAILWVLGEQSPSLLRLKQMGEVVFSGATRRAPAGAAEVVLTLVSDDGHWKEADGRLEVRRRVYRAGPSEYRLNGKTARLKDVMDELMSVGLGLRDYSFIEQGRVGQVLSARPTDRRILIEEAAGITRYKKRKHESALKLEHTRQNLLRLDDVISEVDRTLRQMKRQAGQARRHQRLRDELRGAQQTLLTAEVHDADHARRDVARRRAQIENEVAAAAAALASTEADLSQARTRLEANRTEVEAARAEVAELQASRERLEAFLERSGDLIDQLRESLDRARRDRLTVSSTRSELEGKIAEATARRTALDEALGAVRAAVDEATTAEAEGRIRLADAESQANELRQELLRTISSLTTSRNRLGELERERDRVAYVLGQLEHERGTLVARRDDTENRYRTAAEDSRSAASAAEELDGRRRELVEQRSRLSDEARTAKDEAEHLGRELWKHRQSLAGIARELARHAAVLEQLVTVLPKGILTGQVGDFLDPAPGLAPLLDRVWSEWLELPVIAAESLAADQLEALAGLEGRLRLAVAGGPAAPLTAPALDGVEPLLDKAGVKPEHLPWLARVLPPAFRCPDQSTARHLAEQHPYAIFVGPDDVVWRGRTVEPPTAGSRHHGALALRDERHRLAAEIGVTTDREGAAASLHRDTARALAEVEGAVADLDGRLLRAEQERARAAAVEQSLAEELSRLRRELEAVDADTERNRKLADEQVGRKTKLEQEAAAFESRTADLEQSVDAAVAALATRRDEATDALRRLDRWQAEARLAEERAAAAIAEQERLAGEGRRLDERIAKLQGDVDQLTSELTATEEEVVRSRTRLAEEQGLLSAARERERRLGEQVSEVATSVDGLDREVRQRRDEHDRARESLHEAEVEQTRLESQWERLRDAAAAELDTTPEELLKGVPDAEAAPEALRETIAGLRDKIESLGPVNLLALKEVDELDQRSTFLTAQRKDLVEALHKLENTIREIDAYCSARFVETLEQVNALFNETFSTLFGGGSATLHLVDEDDPLESGIDITAQPPGKKTQSVQLLSGGEKALTALSLLISLFRIKPSPFCILDEVDAPLDDANVERLADLISSMSEHTQFVLITHNRRTMARAEILYGITMEEPGVSKAVSVRLEDHGPVPTGPPARGRGVSSPAAPLRIELDDRSQ